MIEIIVDGKTLEVDSGQNIALSLKVVDIESFDQSNMGFSKTIKVPITPANRLALGFPEQLQNATRFNDKVHPCSVKDGDVVLMQGVAQIDDIDLYPDNTGYYNMRVVAPEYAWVKAAKETPLRDCLKNLHIDNTSTVPTFIEANANGANQSIYGAVLMQANRAARVLIDNGEELWYDEWYCKQLPFWQLRYVLSKLFAASGYTPVFPTVSRTMLDWAKVYFSGQWSEETKEIATYNKFFVGAGEVVSKTLPYHGEPTTAAYNYLPFTTADVSINDDFNNGGALNLTTDVYTPNAATRVAFKLHLEYISEVKIVDKNKFYMLDKMKFGQLTGSSKFYKVVKGSPQAVGTGTITFDPTSDYRYMYGDWMAWWNNEKEQGAITDWEFKSLAIMIGDNTNGYTVVATALDNIDYIGKTIIEVSKNLTGIVTVEYTFLVAGFENKWPVQYNLPYLRNTLYWLPKEYYDGAVSLDMTIYPYFMEANSQNLLSVVFACSQIASTDAAISLECSVTLKTTLETIETQWIGINEPLTNLNMMNEEIKQIDLLTGIRQMFNLVYITDEASKTVNILPYNDYLYGTTQITGGAVVDYSKQYKAVELGADFGRVVKFSYMESEVFDSMNAESYGMTADDYKALQSYEAQMASNVSSDEAEIQNKMFAFYSGGIVYTSFAAQIVPTDTETTDILSAEQNPEVPIIGILHPLGYLIGIGWNKAMYAQYGTLKGFYDGRLNTINNGRKITIYLYITSDEFNNLQNITGQVNGNAVATMRNLWRLNINGERIYAYLQSVSDYKAGSGASTKCEFITYEP